MSKDHRYVPIKLGSIYSSEMKRPGHISDAFKSISYAGITSETSLMGHRIEIKDYSVYLDNILIARAPENKTKPFKDRFCKAVVYGLIEDPSNIKDKLSEPAIMPDAAPVKLPAKRKEWIPEIIIPEPVKLPARIISGPYSVFGWIPSGRFMIKEENMPGVLA